MTARWGSLSHRAPLLCKLGVGELRVTKEGNTQVYYHDDGFARMFDNELTILSPEVILAEQIDTARIQVTIDELTSQTPDTASERQVLSRRLERLRKKLAIAGNR